MNSQPHRYFAVNKPYNMLSQFISEREADLLGDIAFAFPEGTHAVGRLDKHSEGLLLLTTNKKVTRLLFQDKTPHARVYLVQVKNTVSPEKLQQLRDGVTIRVEGGGYFTTTPCDISTVEEPASLFKAGSGIPVYPPYTWLRISLIEGRYRQIRKMMGAIGHRVLRLVRVSIEDISLDNLLPGEVREIDEASFFKLLKLNVHIPQVNTE